MKKSKKNIFTFEDVVVLNYEQLLAVNGAGGSSSSGGSASGPSGGSGSSSTSKPSSGSTSSTTTNGSTNSGTTSSTPSNSGTTTSGASDSNSSSSSITTSTSNRVENSNEGVANAKPGDTIQRKDGTIVTLTQGDIDWAKKQVGSSSTSTGSSTGNTSSTNTATGTTNSSNSGSTAGNTGSNTNTSTSSNSSNTSTSGSSGTNTAAKPGNTTGSSGGNSTSTPTKPVGTTTAGGTNSTIKTETSAGSSTGTGSTNSTGNSGTSNSTTESKRVENSNEGVANAKPGDTILRDNGTVYTLTQGDIDWAKTVIEAGNTTTGTQAGGSNSGETTTAGSITFPSDATNGNNHFGTDNNTTSSDGSAGTNITTGTTSSDGNSLLFGPEITLPPVSGSTDTDNSAGTNTAGSITFPSDATTGNNHYGTDITVPTVTVPSISGVTESVPSNDVENNGSNTQPTENHENAEEKPNYFQTTDAGIAAAKPGDKIIDGKGNLKIITQVDIDEAKARVDKVTADGKPNKIENATDTLSQVINSIVDNWEKPYDLQSGYRCDNWVEEVLKDAGIDSTKYLTGGTAIESTVANHIETLKTSGNSYKTTLPTENGAYVVFMGDSPSGLAEHAALLVVKDGVATYYDNSSGNFKNETAIYETNSDGSLKMKDSNPILAYCTQGVDDTPSTVIWGYNSMYYQKVE